MSRHPGYDSLEREAMRDRVFSDAHRSTEGGGAPAAAAFLAVAMFLLVGFYSMRQITEQDAAVHVITEGISATTEIDRLLDAHLDDLRETARTAPDGQLIALPDYPLPVNLSREELVALDDAEVRDLMLARSAALIYVDGLSYFDQTGNQSLGFLSVQGMLDQALGALTGSTYRRAGFAAVVLLLVVTAAGGAVLAITPGFRRFRAFGLAILLSSLPGYAGAWLLGFMMRRFGGEDAYWIDLRTLADAMLDVSQRNYLIVGALGALVAVAGVLLELANRYIVERPRKPEPLRPAEPPPELEQLVPEDEVEVEV